MTKAEFEDAEDKIYQAIRSKYGYGEDADALVDLVGDMFYEKSKEFRHE